MNTNQHRALAPFYWYRVTEYGTAEPHLDTPELCRRIDESPRGWFASIEGAIKHGGVMATAFTRRAEPTYDAIRWLETGERVLAGTITVTTITAEPQGFPASINRRVTHEDF